MRIICFPTKFVESEAIFLSDNGELMLMRTASFSYIHFCFFHHF